MGAVAVPGQHGVQLRGSGFSLNLYKADHHSSRQELGSTDQQGGPSSTGQGASTQHTAGIILVLMRRGQLQHSAAQGTGERDVLIS